MSFKIKISLLVLVLSIATLMSLFSVNKNVVYANVDPPLTCYNTWTSGGEWSIIQCLGCKRKSGVSGATDQSTCTQ